MRNTIKKKSPEEIKQKLPASIIENVDDFSRVNEEIKKCEEFLKGENRKIIYIVGKQRELLKKFTESDEFFSRVDFSWCNIYFKISLHKYYYIVNIY